MLNEEKFLQLDERYFIFSDEYNKIINRLKKFKRNQGDIMTFDDLRTMTSYSRKYLIVLFEYLGWAEYYPAGREQKKDFARRLIRSSR